MSDNREFKEVETSVGVITAVVNKDKDFPGINIYLDGELVSITEVCNDTVRTILYDYDRDEPNHTHDYARREE